MIAARYYPEIAGGGEVSTQLIAESLLNLGIDVVVACGRRSNKEGEECVNGVRVRTIPIANLYHYPPSRTVSRATKLAWHLIDRNNRSMSARVRNIIHEESPDILHSHTLDGFSTSIWNAGRQAEIPVVHTLRSYYLLCSNAAMRKRGKNCQTQCALCKWITNPKRHHSNRIQGVIGISQFILDQHLSAGYFQNAQARIIFNPVLRVAEDEPANQVGRQRGSKLQIGFLGRLTEAKGLESTLKQLRNVPVGTFDFHIGGSGELGYQSHLQRCAEGLPVIFHGHVSPQEFLSSLDVLIVPSAWNEPFGRVTVEAFACGVPVIATSTGGTKELIDEGMTGFFFDATIPGSLATVIRRLIDNPHLLPQMRLMAAAKSAQFSREKITKKHLELYQELLA